jgi:hypothetical protein
MADLLVEALPATGRRAAYALLVEQIFPKRLAGLRDHPNPRRLAELVYEELAEGLRQAEPNERLRALEAAGHRAEIRAQSVDSLALAIARYLRDHPTAASKAGDWLDSTVERWMAMAVDGIKAEASQRLELLDAWERSVKTDFPDVWRAHRLEFLHARLNLQSARSGSFSTAAGSLYDFLTEVGAAVENLDIH